MPLRDWIGLDLKAPRAAYPRITGVPAAGDAVFDSLRLILNAGVDYELIALGANRLVIQECRPTGHAATLNEIPPTRRDGIGALAGRFAHFALHTARGAPA